MTMLPGLDLPPLVVVLLLLYGLLIALIFTIWTAFGAGRKGKQAAVRAAPAPEPEPAPEKPAPAAAAVVAPAEPVKPWLRDPPTPRPADSEAVASYSVRAPSRPVQRPVQQPAETPAPRRAEPAAPEPRQEPVAPPAAVVRAPATPAPAASEPAARPQPDSAERHRVPATQNSERARSEDAFERFLRSSGSDRDDF